MHGKSHRTFVRNGRYFKEKMKTIILLLVSIICCSGLQAATKDEIDYYFGVGETYKADFPSITTYSIAAESKKYRLTLSHWDEYSRTAYYWKDMPAHWPLRVMKEHTTLSLTKKIYRTDLFYGINLYFNVGLAYTDRTSRVNSSHLLFKEELGLEYLSVRLYLSHTSNGGLGRGPNTGEDAIKLEIPLFIF